MSRDQSPAPASLWFGLWLIAVAIFFLYFARQIQPLEFADENDPGPRAFPVVLGMFLLGGGIWQTSFGFLSSRTREVTRDRDRPTSWDPVLLVIALLCYLTVVPRFGFYQPTAVFAALMTWRLGARWWAAGLTAAILLVVIQLLFVHVFRVQLPQGGWID